jgi:hypothetical protein
MNTYINFTSSALELYNIYRMSQYYVSHFTGWFLDIKTSQKVVWMGTLTVFLINYDH